METKLIVIDTCALLPNCVSDKGFNIERWKRFLEQNKTFELYITPFSLYELLTANKKPRLLNYLTKSNINVLSYRNFPGIKSSLILSESEKWLKHLRQLIVFECNNRLEYLLFNHLPLKQMIDSDTNKLEGLTNDLKDCHVFNTIAGKTDDLKTWFDGEYFNQFFEKAFRVIERHTGYKMSITDLINNFQTSGDSLYNLYYHSDMSLEDLFLSQYILKMSLKKERRHKIINYVIDALNIHSVFQKNLDAYFITRDKETINLLLEASKHGKMIDETKLYFLQTFLIRQEKQAKE